MRGELSRNATHDQNVKVKVTVNPGVTGVIQSTLHTNHNYTALLRIILLIMLCLCNNILNWHINTQPP